MMITKKELCGTWIKYNKEHEKNPGYIIFNRFGRVKLSNLMGGFTVTGNYRIHEKCVEFIINMFFCSDARFHIDISITGNVLTIVTGDGVEHEYLKCPGYPSGIVDWREIGIMLFSILLTICIFIAITAILHRA